MNIRFFLLMIIEIAAIDARDRFVPARWRNYKKGVVTNNQVRQKAPYRYAQERQRSPIRNDKIFWQKNNMLRH